MNAEQNLRILYALRSDYGSLTTKNLASEMSRKGLKWLDQDRLGAILRNERSLDPEDIKQIEQAFDLCEGWLGLELSDIDKLSTLDVEILKTICTLSVEKKKALHELLLSFNR
jgi:hypothetical protein